MRWNKRKNRENMKQNPKDSSISTNNNFNFQRTKKLVILIFFYLLQFFINLPTIQSHRLQFIDSEQKQCSYNQQTEIQQEIIQKYLQNQSQMSILSQSKGGSRGPLIAVIKIQLDEQNVDRIFLHLKDNDQTLADEFIQKHGLNPVLKKHIYQRIQMSRMSLNKQIDNFSQIQNNTYQNSGKQSFVTPVQKRGNSLQESFQQQKYDKQQKINKNDKTNSPWKNYNNNRSYQYEEDLFSNDHSNTLKYSKDSQNQLKFNNKNYHQRFQEQRQNHYKNQYKFDRSNKYSNYKEQNQFLQKRANNYPNDVNYQNKIKDLQNKRFNYNVQSSNYNTFQQDKKYDDLFSHHQKNINKSSAQSIQKVNSYEVIQMPSYSSKYKNLYDVSGLKLSSNYAKTRNEVVGKGELKQIMKQKQRKIQYTQSQSSEGGLFEKQIHKEKQWRHSKQIYQAPSYKITQNQKPINKTNRSTKSPVKNQLQTNFKINYKQKQKQGSTNRQNRQKVMQRNNVNRFHQIPQVSHLDKIKNRHSQKQIQQIIGNKMASYKNKSQEEKKGQAYKKNSYAQNYEKSQVYKNNYNPSLNQQTSKPVLNKYDKFIEKESNSHVDYISFQNSYGENNLPKPIFKLESQRKKQIYEGKDQYLKQQQENRNLSTILNKITDSMDSNHKFSQIDNLYGSSGLSRPKSQRVLNKGLYESSQKKQDLESTTKFNQQKLFKNIKDFDRVQKLQQNKQLNQSQTNRPSRVKFYNKDEMKSLRQSTMSRSMSKTEISRINKEVTNRLYNEADIKKKYLESLKARAKNIRQEEDFQKQQLTHKPQINILSKILGQRRIKDNISVEDHLIQQGKLMQQRKQQMINIQAVRKLSQCPFRPQISQQTHRIAQKSRSKVSNYSDMRCSKTFINENTFQPSINKLSSQLAKHKGNFQERQNHYLEQKNSKLFRKIQQKRQKQKVDPISGQRLFQPKLTQKSLSILKKSQVRSTKNIHNYLYQLSKVQKPIQQLQARPTLCQQSQKIIYQLHQKRLNWLFLQLDNNQDGIISPLKICIDNIPVQILQIIAPVLYQMQQLNTQLNQQQFKNAIRNLHKSLDPHQKSILYNYNYASKPIRN